MSWKDNKEHQKVTLTRLIKSPKTSRTKFKAVLKIMFSYVPTHIFTAVGMFRAEEQSP